MAMVPATLINALTGLWTSPPESRSYTDTADAIETLWQASAVGGSVSSATIFTPQITYMPLSPVGGFPTAADAAQAFEDACTDLVEGTTFTPVAPVTAISAPPGRLTASVGSLKDALKTIFEAPEAGTDASVQATAIGNAIYTYLAGWEVDVTTPGPTVTATPIV